MSKPRLDFSQFHPLDHHLWEKRCGELYGGRRRHLQLSWWYGSWRQQLWAPFQWPLCKLGKHRWQTWHRRRPTEGYLTMCMYCVAKRPTREEEKFPSPPDFSKS